MKLARIRGVDILVSPVVIVLAAAAVSLGFFTRGLMLTAAVLLHEAAHWAAAGLVGYKLEEIRLFPLGGNIRIGGMFGLNPQREIFIALAGPAANILLVLLTWGFRSLDYAAQYDVDFFIAANTVMFLFNLLPALPLDGGRALRSALSYKWGIASAARLVWLSGRFVAGLLVLLALYRRLESSLEISMIAAAVFLFFAGMAERRMAASLMINQMDLKRSLLRERGLLKSKTLAVAYNAQGKRVIDCFGPGYYHIVFVIGRDGEILGRVGEHEIFSGIMQLGYSASMEEIVKMYNS